MKIKWSGVGMVDGRGKINGSVASKNRAGAYVRTKVTPVNPDTTAQRGARTRLASLSSAWRGLTQSKRDAWNAAVDDYQSTDIFGDLRKPTGKNLFTALNINLFNAGQSAITDPLSPVGVTGIAIDSLTINITTPTYELAHSLGDSSVTVLVFATAPLSAGVSFVKSEFRLIQTFAGNAASPVDIETAYTAKFGTPPAGSKVFVRCVPINNTTGQAGQASQNNTIVVS